MASVVEFVLERGIGYPLIHFKMKGLGLYLKRKSNPPVCSGKWFKADFFRMVLVGIGMVIFSSLRSAPAVSPAIVDIFWGCLGLLVTWVTYERIEGFRLTIGLRQKSAR